MKNIVFSFLFCTVLLPAFGQETTDSSKTNKVKKLLDFYCYAENEFEKDSLNLHKLDSTFAPFFYYNPQFHNFKTNLGNNGTAQKDLTYSPTSRIGFKTKMDQIDDFRFNHYNTKYYNLTQPYAKASYINGAQKEEGINILFSQNINPSWNVGVEYKKVSSVGFYERQRTGINNFKVFQSFKTKNNRYGIIANLNYNDSRNEENGGIQADSIFTDLPKTGRKGVPINFSDAANSSRNQELYVKQFLNFGKTITTRYVDENDSIYPDSIISTYIVPVLSPFHEFIYNNKEFGFEDNKTAPENYPLGSVAVNQFISDATNLKEIDNNLGLRWNIFRHNKGVLTNTSLSVYGGFQYLEYFQKEFNTSLILTNLFYTNSLLGASFKNETNNKNHFSISYNSVFAGFDKGDKTIHFLSVNKFKKMKIMAGINLDRLNPDLVFRNFKSTTYNWQKNLNLINRTTAKLELEIANLNFKIGGNYNKVENHTFFNSLSEVNQFKGTINIYQAYIYQKFKFWKLHLKLNIRYQQVDQSGIINLPDLLTYSSFYFESTLFKKDMLFRVGTDLYFASDYAGDSYNPIIRQYQSQTKTTINSYPWLEAYLMVKVERTYFFVRMNNLLEGAVPYNYFAAPGYPLADRAFKFGIKWEFIN